MIGTSLDDVGLTDYQTSTIYIKRLDFAFMIKTLKHELCHVWLFENGHNQSEKEFNCEDICEIVACSNNFINEIINEYVMKKQTLIKHKEA